MIKIKFRTLTTKVINKFERWKLQPTFPSNSSFPYHMEKQKKKKVMTFELNFMTQNCNHRHSMDELPSDDSLY